MSWIQKLDSDLFLWLNSLGQESFDSMWLLLTGRSLWYVVFAVLLILSLYFFRIQFWKSIIILAVPYGLADYISVHFFKNVFQRLRPCHNPEIMDQVRLVVEHCGGQFGFVSSHASNSFALAVAATLVFRNKWITTAMMIWAAVTTYSRIYVGVHYPGDALVGALLGAGIAWLVYRISVRFLPLKKI